MKLQILGTAKGSGKVPALKAGEDSLIALPASARKSLEERLRVSDARFGANERKEIRKVWKDTKAAGPSILKAKVHSQSARIHFLLVDGKVSSFELHTVLRELCEESVKDAEGRYLLDIASLDLDMQKNILDAFVRLSLHSVWKPEKFGKTPQAKREANFTLLLRSGLQKSEAEKLYADALLLGEANNLVRTLSELPANILNPDGYRKRIEDLCKKQKLELQFFDRKALEKKSAGGFLAVDQGNPQSEGGIARINYTPKNPKFTVALIGKGLCFDTGGYDIKVGGMMNGMHRDMTGSAVVLATINALAKMKVDFEIHAWMAITENLISETAFKANEVVTTVDGTTIEVIDTDAEGRMVLSDTLSLARAEKPDLMIDFATLTGAAMRAIGTQRSALFTNRDELLPGALGVGNQVGERLWPFPCGEDFRKALDSKVADILQLASSNLGDHLYAATFLRHFAGDIPWLHVDLSASKNNDGLGLVSTKATGFGVKWAVEYLKGWNKL